MGIAAQLASLSRSVWPDFCRLTQCVGAPFAMATWPSVCLSCSLLCVYHVDVVCPNDPSDHHATWYPPHRRRQTGKGWVKSQNQANMLSRAALLWTTASRKIRPINISHLTERSSWQNNIGWYTSVGRFVSYSWVSCWFVIRVEQCVFAWKSAKLQVSLASVQCPVSSGYNLLNSLLYRHSADPHRQTIDSVSTNFIT